jgi:hypothetical protein
VAKAKDARQICSAIESIPQIRNKRDPWLTQLFFCKLHPSLKLKHHIQISRESRFDFEKLLDFFDPQAKYYRKNPEQETKGQAQLKTLTQSMQKGINKDEGFTNTPQRSIKCLRCNGPHTLYHCEQ